MEANTTPERARTVTTAVYLLYVSLVCPSIGILLFWLAFREADLFRVAFWGSALLGSLVISTLLYYLIGRGKNWARINFAGFLFTNYALEYLGCSRLWQPS